VRRRLNPTIVQLMVDVSAGIRVLQTRDGIRLTEGQIRERTRNIVMGLVGNYRIEAFANEPRADIDQGAMLDSDENEAATASFGDPGRTTHAR
jgi:hypothetical protein